MTDLVRLALVDSVAVERLLDRAFGTDRHTRTAYKVRGAGAPDPALSFAAVEGDALIGTIQCWPIRLTADAGGSFPLVMVGPVAVDPARQQEGLGRALTRHMLGVAAVTSRDRAMTLIGDPEYYERFFGFSAARTSAWRLPGPVEMRRLLARGPDVPDLPGLLGPA